MLAYSCLRFSAVYSFVLTTLLGSASAWASPPEEPISVELFAAIESGQAEVRVIPRDSKVLNMLVRNCTDRPLRLEMPAALAAAPIAAQPANNIFGGGINNNIQFGNNNNNSNSSQAVGLPAGRQNNNNMPFANPFMNVPAGREIKLRLACVCLEHGKPEPNTRIAYELTPLSDYSDDPRVTTAIAALGNPDFDQRVVQLAVWNLVNGKSWEELAAQKIEHLNGLHSPMFQQREIESAQEFVEHLTEASDKSRKLSSQ